MLVVGGRRLRLRDAAGARPRPLFAILIATILIPPTVAIVPQFILFSRLGWVGTYLPLIVPSLFGSAFFIFLFRQWFRNLPPHLFESAELDGATPLQAFRHIALPLAGPAIAAVAVFAFVGVVERLPRAARLPALARHVHGQRSAWRRFQGVYVNDVHLLGRDGADRAGPADRRLRRSPSASWSAASPRVGWRG